jgi:hypothetical protein
MWTPLEIGLITGGVCVIAAVLLIEFLMGSKRP